MTIRKVSKGSIDLDAPIDGAVYYFPEVAEYQVRFYYDGVRDEAADYYTDDKQDAFDTLEWMKNHYNPNLENAWLPKPNA